MQDILIKELDGIIHICGWHMENKIKPIVTNQTKLNKTLKSMEIDYNAVKIFPSIDSERVQNGSRLERVLAWGLGGKFE